jgi:hypothetical protein
MYIATLNVVAWRLKEQGRIPPGITTAHHNEDLKSSSTRGQHMHYIFNPLVIFLQQLRLYTTTKDSTK